MPNKSEILQLISLYGNSSTSFLTSYDGYHYFQSELGVIAYVETPSAWVGAGGPLLKEEGNALELLRQFNVAAAKNKKIAMLLPVGASLASALRNLGCSAVQIGAEPWFSFENIPQKIHQATQKLLKKGAVVEAFNPLLLSTQERNALDLITQEWLKARKMAPLSFLNRVEPWRFFTHKRYFRVIYNGIQVGYLAAVPIPSKNSWYLVDLIRATHAPVGTTELLIVEASKQLKKQGASMVTLGMSPLVPVLKEEKKYNTQLYWFFEKMFTQLNFIYGFSSLYAYKGKFNPSAWEAQYLVTFEAKLKSKVFINLFYAMYPKGFSFILRNFLSKIPQLFSVKKVYQKIFNHDFVPQSPPKNLKEFFQKSKVTFSLIFLQIIFFGMTVDSRLSIKNEISERHAFRGAQFFENTHMIHDLMNGVFASFLHWNWLHLSFNVFLMMIFMVLLEASLGALPLLFSYGLGIAVVNPITFFILYPIVKLFSSLSLLSFTHEQDLGCSLGVFTVMGVLFCLTRYSKILMMICILLIMLVSLVTSSFMGLNHLTALILGLLLGKRYLSSL